MIAKKLLKSKKGGIPAVNELVMTFLNVTPKPILALIFILLITTLATFFIPVFLNLFGYECLWVDDEIELYQVPVGNIVPKTLLNIGQLFESVFGFEEFKLPEDPFPYGDKHFMRIPEQCWVSSDLNGSTVYGVSGKCLRCQTNANFLQWFTVNPTTNAICVGDATENNVVINNEFCTVCQLPPNYYYNHSWCVNQSRNGYDCYYRIIDDSDLPDEDYERGLYYSKIIQLGGVERSQSMDDFVNIQCEDEGRPQLYFFSIKIFDRTLWIYLFCAWALITLAMMWYGLTLNI